MPLKKSYALILASLLCASVNAYQSGASDAGNQVDGSDQPVERVEVLGQRPTKFYLDLYREREKDFLAHFNQLVEDKDMLVKCKMRNDTGSRVRTRKCEPRYVTRIQGEEKQQAIASFGYTNKPTFSPAVQANVNGPYVDSLIKGKSEHLAVDMAQLVNENPELKERFLLLKSAKEEYEKRK